jgi:raffinose/stachyose/melibiose transport system permease protein
MSLPISFARRRAVTAERRRRPGEPRLVGFLYILPAFALYGLFVLLPAIDGAWISLFRWDGVSLGSWAGIGNYVDAVGDSVVQASFIHAIVLIVFYSIGPVCLGLLVTAVLARRPIRGLTTFRTVIFLPQVLAAVVIGVAWQWMYDPEGPINALLGAIGLGGLERAWLGDFGTALPAVGVIGTWATTGLCAVLFIAGVQQIPLDRYDAARVDGANPLQEFFAVTLPGLRNEIVVALLLTVIDALRAFDIIFVTTKGGPGTESYVPTILIYKRAFQSGEVGSAAAIAAILTAVILILSVGIRRLEEAREA